jgi:hypothetical protein
LLPDRREILLHRKSICSIAITVGLLLTGTPLALAQSAPAGDGPPRITTCDEWKSHLDRIFTANDRNRDGRLDQSEFAAVRRADAMLADPDFGYFDENQDGKITRSEFVSEPSAFIVRFDRNGDCRVTPDEMRAPESIQTGRPPRDKWH